MLGTISLLAVGIIAIIILARLNKSNKLFWILLISMLAGFVGGSVASYTTNKASKQSIDATTGYIINPTINGCLIENFNAEEPVVLCLAKPKYPILSESVVEAPHINNHANGRTQPRLFDSS